MNIHNFTIFTFYQFKNNKDIKKIKNLLKSFCSFNKIRGTIIIAEEGINGTVAGLDICIKKFLDELKLIGFINLEKKKSYYKFMPFNRLKIKIKKEIVTFSDSILNVEQNTGIHVSPKNWNDLIEDDNTIVIDVRNNFENKIGSFKNAISPNTKKFSEFKNFIKKLSKKNNKKIAMFCTGGIRCEKASSYMLKKGFKNIYQLKGGILSYLEKIPKNNSKWHGECFVFDNRVSVKNELNEGTYELCHGCRMPVSKKDRQSIKYKKGVSCNFCFDILSLEKKEKLEERNKQIQISKKKGIYNPYIKYTPFDFL